MSLTFDAQRMFKDIVDYVLIPSANQAMESIYKYIKRGLISSQDIQKRTFTPVEIEEAKLDEMQDKITSACASYGWSLLVSYGAGIYMDKSNEDLSKYINSQLWNPLRPRRAGSRITGRKMGIYYNTLGAKYSNGKRAGKTISGWRTLREGIKPNYAIQNAEKKLEQGLEEDGFVFRILQTNLERFFNEVNTSDYFDDGR